MKFNEKVSDTPDTPPLTLFANCNYSIADLAPHSPFFAYITYVILQRLSSYISSSYYIWVPKISLAEEKKIRNNSIDHTGVKFNVRYICKRAKKNRQDLNINKRFLRLARAHSLFHCRPILFYFKQVRPQKVY